MKIKVTNRDDTYAGYYIPEMNIKRSFSPSETKELEENELRALAWTKGGRSLISNHLIIEDEKLVKELLGEVEPEYYYTTEDVKKLLIEGSEEALLDALDFAPDGTRELIKNTAISMKLNDVRKRDIISKAFGFDINSSIRINEESEQVEGATKARRVTEGQNAEEAPETAKRRAPVYNIKKS